MSPSVRIVMFQGSYRYRPVTELSLAKKPLRHPSVVLPKNGHAGQLTKPAEKALFRYIDRLNYLSLAIQPKFITDAANAILQACSSKNAKALPKVSHH